MGDVYLSRVVGFRPNDPSAVEYAAEQIAKEVGTLRGGDGYGYSDDYGDGLYWFSLNVGTLDDDRAYIDLSAWKIEPSGSLTLTGTIHHKDWGADCFTFVAVDEYGEKFTKYQASADRVYEWQSEPEPVDEYWVVELVDPSNQHHRNLIRKARWGANGTYGYERQIGSTVATID
jgi:hypothetical protein